MTDSAAPVRRPDREFGEKVTEFVTVDDQMKAAQGPMKTLRERSKELRAWIARAMDDNGYTEVKIKDGAEVLTVSERKKRSGPPTAELIRGRFQRYLERCRRERKAVVAAEMYEWVYGKDGAAKEEAEARELAGEEDEVDLVLLRRVAKKKTAPKPKKAPAPKRQKRVVELPGAGAGAESDARVQDGDDDSAALDEALEEERAMGMDS